MQKNMRSKADASSSPVTGNMHTIDIISYNTHSLLSGGRLEVLRLELQHVSWDVVAVQETWREDLHEEIVFDDGHRFYGSGGFRGRCGVGFMVNKCLGDHKFLAVNERIAILDLDQPSCRIRVISVYMPDITHPDLEVEAVYAELEGFILEAKSKNMQFILVGDFNAQVGARDEDHDDAEVVGPQSSLTRNDRGNALVRWCTLHDLVVANSHFDMGSGGEWTYCKGHLRRQLDYILVSRQLFRFHLLQFGLASSVDIGSDHRALDARLLSNTRSKTDSRQKRKTGPRIWKRMKRWIVRKLPKVLVGKHAGCLFECHCTAGFLGASYATSSSGRSPSKNCWSK